MEELKPCPFCGAIPELYDLRKENYNSLQIVCDNDSCHVQPEIYLSLEGYRKPIEDIKKIIIGRWNTRE